MGHWLTPPATSITLGTGCSAYMTVHSRRPSVPHRHDTNVEQFASRSDVIKFPANLQNETKISFVLAVLLGIYHDGHSANENMKT